MGAQDSISLFSRKSDLMALSHRFCNRWTRHKHMYVIGSNIPCFEGVPVTRIYWTSLRISSHSVLDFRTHSERSGLPNAFGHERFGGRSKKVPIYGWYVPTWNFADYLARCSSFSSQRDSSNHRARRRTRRQVAILKRTAAQKGETPNSSNSRIGGTKERSSRLITDMSSKG